MWADLNMILAHVCAGSLSLLYFILDIKRCTLQDFTVIPGHLIEIEERFPVLVWADLNVILAHVCAGSLSLFYFILETNRLYSADYFTVIPGHLIEIEE